MKKSLVAVSASISILFLSACGGGGGGGDSVPVNPIAKVESPPVLTVPLASAVSAYMQTSHNYASTTTSGTDTYRLQLSFSPGPQATFEGHVVSTTSVTSVATKNGVQQGGAFTGTDYFDLSPYKAWGSVGSDGSYVVMSNQQLLPSSATIGQSGPLDNTTYYTDNTKKTVLASGKRTWSIEPDTV